MTYYFAINRLAGAISQTVHWSLCVGDSSIPLWTLSIWFVDFFCKYFLCHKDSSLLYVFGFCLDYVALSCVLNLVEGPVQL